MKAVLLSGLCVFILFGSALGQHQSTDDANTTTVRGCLQRSMQSDLVVQSLGGFSYALLGIGDKLDGEIGHWLEVKGVLIYDTKTKKSARLAKQRRSSSDSGHGANGEALHVADVATDVHRVADHCLSR